MKNLNELEKLRGKIEIIDLNIAKLLKERMEIVIKISNIKAKNRMPIKDKTREKELLKKISTYLSENKKNNLFLKQILKIFRFIHKQSRIIQK
jgi:chorismate mutase